MVCMCLHHVGFQTPVKEVIVDVDAETMHDPCYVGLYVSHIFQYYKEREVSLAYGGKQKY